MPVMVAVADSQEGVAALHAGVAEARRFGTDLLVINLGLRAIELADVTTEVTIRVLDRNGRGDRDPVTAVLDEIDRHGAERLVICLRHRTPAGKALLGSVSQRLLLEAPVPVLAVKL